MQTLENEFLIVGVADSGALEVLDKRAGVTWRQPFEVLMVKSVGERWQRPPLEGLAVTRQGEGLRATAHVPRPEAGALTLTWDVQLAGQAAMLRMEPLAGLRPGEALELVWPQGLVAVESGRPGYLVLPIRTGQLLLPDADRCAEVHEDLFYDGLKMALFGAVRGRGAVAVIVRSPYDAGLRTEANIRGHYLASPRWLVEEGRLNEARELSLVFLADASYVEIAKAYRAEMQAQGRLVTLREKVAGAPLVEQLVGAVTGERRSYTLDPEGPPGHPGIRRFFEQAKELGFDRACIWFAGASSHGAAGEDLRREVEAARALSPGFRLSSYTNLIDIDPQSAEYDPGDVLRLRDGSARINWYTTHTVCTARRLARAQRRMPEVLAAIGPGNVYVDVEGAIGLMECFSPAHPMTRAQDAAYRRELLRAIKQMFGSVTTEHLPHDFLCDVVDMGAYTAIYPYQVFAAHPDQVTYFDAQGRDWYVHASCPFQTVPIPLFQLVWHESVLGMNSSGKTADSFGWLEDYPCEPLHLPLYGLLPDDLSQRSLVMSRAMRASYYAELVEHRFLTGPTMEYTARGLYRTRDVQLSRFSDGTVVVANFSDEPYFYDSHTPVPMHEFTVIRPGCAPLIA